MLAMFNRYALISGRLGIVFVHWGENIWLHYDQPDPHAVPRPVYEISCRTFQQYLTCGELCISNTHSCQESRGRRKKRVSIRIIED
jgi:hypothetical protein